MYTPVQVQKLFFLIDREAAHLVGGPHFDFRPYHYGPFDKEVYRALDSLALQGLAISAARSYGLTPTGQRQGAALLATLDTRARTYIEEVSAFVRRLSFASLVSAIYKAYPEMRVNSVFQA
jgi:hypothetical protein